METLSDNNFTIPKQEQMEFNTIPSCLRGFNIRLKNVDCDNSENKSAKRFNDIFFLFHQ